MLIVERKILRRILEYMGPKETRMATRMNEEKNLEIRDEFNEPSTMGVLKSISWAGYII